MSLKGFSFFTCLPDLCDFPRKEHQLLKDRKKNVRKRSQGENCSSPSTISSHGRTSGHDNRSVRLVLVDSQNIQKVGSGKPPLKRPLNAGVHRGNGKVESTTMKPARQRRKPGTCLCSSTDYIWLLLFTRRRSIYLQNMLSVMFLLRSVVKYIKS